MCVEGCLQKMPSDCELWVTGKSPTYLFRTFACCGKANTIAAREVLIRIRDGNCLCRSECRDFGVAVGFVFDAFQCKIQRGQVVSELRGVEAFKGKRDPNTLMR